MPPRMTHVQLSHVAVSSRKKKLVDCDVKLCNVATVVVRPSCFHFIRFVLFGDRSEKRFACRLHRNGRAYDRHYKFKQDKFSFGHLVIYTIFYGTLNILLDQIYGAITVKSLKSHPIVPSNFMSFL